ncbi:hypothetical protein [Streptomyces adelaidensis]|uniref:hypothetical protein n=1 Tax=Streptomyces adelaidensis TaxID=2796465 RepID=UPI0019080A62|nr:hypothetical protein [Streptomyces adelaidensis]
MNRALLNRLITDWLARAHPHPDRARAEWSDRGVALLPMATRFSAVRLSSQLVHAAVGTHEPKALAEELAFRLDGAVIHDSFSVGRAYYALVHWHAGLVWDNNDNDAQCLGADAYLGVPRIERVAPPGTYWLVPPQYEGDYCRPEAVRRLVEQGRAVLAVDDTVGAAS